MLAEIILLLLVVGLSLLPSKNVDKAIDRLTTIEGVLCHGALVPKTGPNSFAGDVLYVPCPDPMVRVDYSLLPSAPASAVAQEKP